MFVFISIMRELYELNKKQGKKIESTKLVENVESMFGLRYKVVAVFGEHSLYLHLKAPKP